MSTTPPHAHADRRHAAPASSTICCSRRCRIRSSCSATTTASSTPTRRPNRSSRAAWHAEAHQTLDDIIAFGCPLAGAGRPGSRAGLTVNEYGVEVAGPKFQTPEAGRRATAAPCRTSPASIVLMLQQRNMAQMIERQLTHRAAARSVSGLASVLAHEIKNPLSGIRGAAQLLEQNLTDDDRALTQLICSETDRIRNLVDRMEVFGDERPLQQGAGQHPRRARSRAPAVRIRLRARHPLHRGLRSLAAARARQPRQARAGVPQPRQERRRGDRREQRAGPRSSSQTSFRPGVRLSVQGSDTRISLPLMIQIEDNGSGRSRSPEAAPVRSVRHHQAVRHRPRPRARRQDHQRPRRHHRVRQRAQTHRLPRPAADAGPPVRPRTSALEPEVIYGPWHRTHCRRRHRDPHRAQPGAGPRRLCAARHR